MITVNLTMLELQRLINIVNKQINSDYYGSDEFLIPEYQILKDKIDNSIETLELNNIEIDLLCTWISDVKSNSQIVSPVDESLLTKIFDEINILYNKLKSEYLYKLKNLQDNLNKLAIHLNKKEFNYTDIFSINKTEHIDISNKDENNETEELKYNPNLLDEELKSSKSPDNNDKNIYNFYNKLSEEEKMKNVTDLANKMKILAKKLK
jgi:hypothetical protein